MEYGIPITRQHTGYEDRWTRAVGLLRSKIQSYPSQHTRLHKAALCPTSQSAVWMDRFVPLQLVDAVLVRKRGLLRAPRWLSVHFSDAPHPSRKGSRVSASFLCGSVERARDAGVKQAKPSAMMRVYHPRRVLLVLCGTGNCILTVRTECFRNRNAEKPHAGDLGQEY